MIDLSDLTQSEREYVLSFPTDRRREVADTIRKIKENSKRNAGRGNANNVARGQMEET